MQRESREAEVRRGGGWYCDGGRLGEAETKLA